MKFVSYYFKNFFGNISKKVFEYASGKVFTTIKFRLKLTNGTNKLECLSLASLSSQVLCDTLAYWAHPFIRKKMVCCEHTHRGVPIKFRPVVIWPIVIWQIVIWQIVIWPVVIFQIVIFSIAIWQIVIFPIVIWQIVIWPLVISPIVIGPIVIRPIVIIPIVIIPIVI
jgi:hypothetical protein